MLAEKVKHIISGSAVTFPLYAYLRHRKNNRYNDLSDEEFAQMCYQNKCGKKLNLERPVTLDEKIWWLKLYDKNPLYKICTDKLTVRDYVRGCGLGSILTRIGKKTYSSYKEVVFNELPGRCLLKCNHSSGCNMIYDRSKEFDYGSFRREFGYWMARDYFWSSREYNYKGIQPRIFCEEFLTETGKAGLVDYRFMCFHGEVKFIMVDIGTMDPGGGGDIPSMPGVIFTTGNLHCSQSGLPGKILNLA